ncbi:nitroreductase family deazaflavin-dependent oxidoreductase [Paractinoplanes atraurantiacus]|uniref:nitroreductase family deazaflavin-dependent oxidoreductase n=1 Tax=Paractinoplanes atraurantiacus TaxID=1036182 RepID=UPI001C54051D|nr:nitroreductase family deazaflavin-dependent oxidoreductase [Actinoplanes atraurantiacus]
MKLYRLRLGWLFGRRLAMVEHLGRRTGHLHQVVLEVVELDPATGALTVASGFGPKADWYRNLRAHPATDVVIGIRRIAVRAEPVPTETGAEIMRGYARRHPRTARRLAGFLGYELDGTDDDFAEFGRTLPFLRLIPDGRKSITRPA